MRKRWFAVLGLVAALGASYAILGTPQGSVTAMNGRAVPMNGSDEMFMVTLDLQNDGDPVTLQNVRSPTGAHVSFTNHAPQLPIVIPGKDTAQLAMDGVHIMLHVPAGDFPSGTYHSLSLAFDDGSKAVARILHPALANGPAAMTHNMAHGIETSPAPSIALAREPDHDANGFDVSLQVENFTFVLVEDSAPHVDGQGHAHIYLNGVKLGRLYDTRFAIGALLPGDYTLTIALNGNDHRPYVSNGTSIALTYEFKI